MKILHLNAGAETGGGMVHILALLNGLNKDEFILGVMEKGKMYEEAKKKGINVKHFSQASRYDLSIIKQIADYIVKENIDILHTHGPRANLMGYIIKKISKVKWIVTVHSDPRDDFLGSGIKGKIFTKINMLTLRNVDHYFAISDRFKEMLIQFKINEKRITTIYNGIDFNLDIPITVTRQRMGYSNNDFILLMVARLHPVKGHKEAFQAISNLITTYPNIRLLLVGDGPLKEELQEKIAYLNLEENVKLLGHREDVHSLLSISDIKILTSYSESFPLVILEAARAKVPVITTDVGGVEKLIKDSSYGWIIPIKDIQCLERAILEAYNLKRTNELKSKGEKLYHIASENYSVEKFCSSVYETYRKILRQ
ncbi:glycosyltransferase family 4 protein [Sutcliffiella sp. NPDC057660]|uniref:glycosyltransferase family 4 protein n=1 Tax=Sutcliffiella sp. NPDC057660 TaxID=3346199 RepID=UPI003678398C